MHGTTVGKTIQITVKICYYSWKIKYCNCLTMKNDWIEDEYEEKVIKIKI